MLFRKPRWKVICPSQGAVINNVGQGRCVTSVGFTGGADRLSATIGERASGLMARTTGVGAVYGKRAIEEQ